MKMHNFVFAAMALTCGALAQAAVTAEEAAKLGKELTPVGAEQAGNKDGTIPPYTGGLTEPPATFKKGSGIRPDPFFDEKPQFSIDAKNMEKYADKLTEGTKALMKTFPSYRIDVYKTHRTAAYPKYVLDNTKQCAVKAKTTNNGLAMEGCHAGVPFPIPKSGYETMWNHLVRYWGRAYSMGYKSTYVDMSGKPTTTASGIYYANYPYYDRSETGTDLFWQAKSVFTSPARKAGEVLMLHDPLDATKRRAWTYLPGQRRVKLAPSIGHDTPNPSTAGINTYDDHYIFIGSMERFNFKLIGKKEMYVPYNAYKLAYQAKGEDLFKPNHLNPDFVRWELHRVWVVEATLADGKRHIYSKRRFYLDEDSWTALASDEYDMRGELYKAGFAYIAPSYDAPAPTAETHGFYDLISRSYSLEKWSAEEGGLKLTEPMPDRDWSPDAMAGQGIR